MLGRDDLGRLAPGSKADIIVIDLSPLRTGPIEDPIRTLLMNANGRDVKTVIVDGRTVVEDGVIPGLDVEATRRRAQARLPASGTGCAIPTDVPDRGAARRHPLTMHI
jgi:8-oxoguanine deaminase